MHTTIFDTPGVNTVLRLISIAFLRVTGWKVLGSLPHGVDKCVLIAAPHTSNWDLPYTLMVAFALRLHIYWVGKASIFSPPFRGVMMWLGGIPVDRSRSNNMVAAAAEAIRSADKPVQLVVPPEGTRSKARYWKTGFYYIAHAADVPIVMAFMDYKKKETGLGPVFRPTGDIEADMQVIKTFYAPIRGKNEAQFDASH